MVADDVSNGRWSFDEPAKMAVLWPGASFGRLGTDPFRAVVLRRTLERTRIEGIASTAYRVERTAELARRHPADVVAVAVVLSGTCTLRRSGRSFTARAGDVFVHRSEIYDYDCPERGRTFRSLLPPALVPQVAERGLYPFVRCEPSELTGAFVRFAHEVLRTTSETPLLTRTASQLERALITLQRGVIEEALLTEGETLPATDFVLLRAMRVIEAELSNPSLTPDAVAAQVGVSRRRLFQAFEGEPESVAATIRRRRIESASRDLEIDSRLAVASVAQRYGFPSRDTFARAFRAHHGKSVAEYRSELVRDGLQ